MNSDKDMFRTESKQRFLAYDPRILHTKSLHILRAIHIHPRFIQAHTVALYEPFPDEPDISSLITGSKHVIVISQDGSDPGLILPLNTFFIIPGRAFTLQGGRIGRGKGWYDRFLIRYPEAYKLGVCFSFQIYETLPQDAWDVMMDEVLIG